MEILNQIRGFLLPEDLEVHIYKSYLHVSGFTSIGEIGSEKILIRHQEGTLMIKGQHLVLSKLCGDEVLIRGVVKQVEFR